MYQLEECENTENSNMSTGTKSFEDSSLPLCCFFVVMAAILSTWCSLFVLLYLAAVMLWCVRACMCSYRPVFAFA